MDAKRTADELREQLPWLKNRGYDGVALILDCAAKQLETMSAEVERLKAESEKLRHFNQLSPAEMERLALLIEEMGEANQIIGKVLRHGYESRNPLQPGPTNREALETELGHVGHAAIRLCESRDLSKAQIHWYADKKSESVEKWLHHQPKPSTESV